MIRVLRADEIECKVAQVSQKGLTLLLYKTARTDMDILDETFGMNNWSCKYEEIKGNMYCTISIFDEKKNQWIDKQDCGVESAFGDKEKGEASDAFKRAGFKVGIGRELYTSPFIWVSADKCKIIEGKKCYDKFEVMNIDYDEKRNIKSLQIINASNGELVFDFGGLKSKNDKSTKPKGKTSKTADNEGIMGKEEMLKYYAIPYMKEHIDFALEQYGKKFSELSDDEKVEFTTTMRNLYNEVENNGNNN